MTIKDLLESLMRDSFDGIVSKMTNDHTHKTVGILDETPAPKPSDKK